jgi:hypothetical protein
MPNAAARAISSAIRGVRSPYFIEISRMCVLATTRLARACDEACLCCALAREHATCGVAASAITLDEAKMLVFLLCCSNRNAVSAILRALTTIATHS